MAISLKLMTAVRIFTLLFPPLGLVLLWRLKGIGLLRKLFGTLGILLYTILYGAGIAALLMYFTGLEVEWQGGFPPVLTWHKTHPNYEAVEANRKAQAAKPLVITAAPQSAEWPGFRGPNRDGRYDGHSIVTNWPAAGLTPLWKQPVGGGYASFAIAGNCAFTIEQRREDEAVTAYDVRPAGSFGPPPIQRISMNPWVAKGRGPLRHSKKADFIRRAPWVICCASTPQREKLSGE